MTTKEIREKETDHLKHELVEKRKHLYDLRSQAVTEKLEDPSQLRKTRKVIARMKTILRQRELDEQKKSEPSPEKTTAKKPETRTVKKTAKKSVKKTATK